MTPIEDLEYRLEWLWRLHHDQAIRQDTRFDLRKGTSLWPIRTINAAIRRLDSELAHERSKHEDG